MQFSGGVSGGFSVKFDSELQKSVFDVLAAHPQLSWNPAALQAKVKYYHPKLKPSKEQIEVT